MTLPKKSEVADANFEKTRARQNRRFLHDVVLPHVEKMPTREDFDDDSMPQGTALFNLDDYCTGTPSGPITAKYNCGRQGCFAGWYVYISDKYKRLSYAEQVQLDGYDDEGLADHFGVTILESNDLFSPLGSGAESTLNEFDTKSALATRAKKLKSIMRRKGDFR